MALVVICVFPVSTLAQPQITLFATLCMNATPGVCIKAIVTDSTMSNLTMASCMGVEGQNSALQFATEHPQYAAKWFFKGWSCQFGQRINERGA